MGEDLTIESLQSIEGYTIKEIEDKPSGFNSHTSTKLRIFRKAAEQQRFVAFPFLCKGEHSVNSILNDYSTITEIELNKRISYYEHTDFSTDTIELLVPDTVSYVRKIFNCLRWATQNREIIEDVCKQIVETRISRKQLVQSVGYKVGNSILDGRAFAQQNIHQYCRYIAEINDCLCQILNIVFCVGYRQWERFDADQILSHANIKKHSNICKLCKQFYSLIKLHKRFDNFDKHNLILWGHEKLTLECINNVEYYFNMDSQQYKMSEFINELHEHRIKVSIIELLDNIFSLATPSNQPARKYAHVLFDILVAKNGPPIYTERYMAQDNLIQLKIDTYSDNNCLKAKSVSYYHDESPISSKIYLARLDQEMIDGDILQINRATLDVNSFEVFQNVRLIGKYECQNKEDKITEYFHFKEFVFIPV